MDLDVYLKDTVPLGKVLFPGSTSVKARSSATFEAEGNFRINVITIGGILEECLTKANTLT